MSVQPVDLVFISAHPDDIELCCGGTIIHCVDRGQKVGIVDLTSGEMGTRGNAETRKRESEEAEKLMGSSFRLQLDFGDGGLKTGREQELELIRVLRSARPSIVFAPWPDDRHPDHSRAGRIVTEASFYSGLTKIDTGQKAHRPQTVAYFLQNYMQPPSFIVDVSAAHERKMKAVAAFKSQFYNPDSTEPSTRIAEKSFLAMIEGRARHYGGMIGAEFGEPFVTKLPPRVQDVVAAYGGREIS